MRLPGRDLLSRYRYVIDPAAETLTVHDADLNLCRVEPTDMFGRIVQVQSIQDAFRFGG